MKLGKGALAKKLYHEAPASFKPLPRKRKKGWWGLVAALMSGLSVVTVVILFYLSLCANIVQEQYKVDHLESILPQVQEENAALLIAVRHLTELSRIDRIARVDLKMGLPDQRFMIVEPGIERVAEIPQKVASLLSGKGVSPGARVP